MVQPRGRLRQLHEVAEILDRAVPAALVEVHDERAAVGRREDHVPAADPHVVGRVAGNLRELGRCGLQNLAQHPGFELQPPDIGRDLGHIGAGLPVKPHRLGILAQFDADLGQDAIGGRLDARQAFVGQDVIGGDAPNDVGPPFRLPALQAGFAPLRSPAALALRLLTRKFPVCHGRLLLSIGRKLRRCDRRVTLEKFDGLDKVCLWQRSAASSLRSTASWCSNQPAGCPASPPPPASCA
jgi:hypothetical protein